MSIHRSLRQAGGKTGATRNVLKRHERLRLLVGRGTWAEDRSIFGLPKMKQERVKVRKAAPKEAAPKEGAAPETPASAAKPAKSSPTS